MATNNTTKSSFSSEKFTFFFRSESPFSQWHPCTFKGTPLFNNDDNTTTEYEFHNCEQWMMMNKACLFNDIESAKKIMNTSDPKVCKALGRKVKNFDLNIWIQHNEKIIFEGNKLKFTQNPLLMKKLQETIGTTLVEASPYDKIYGIGLGANNPDAKDRNKWKGKNLLGQILTQLRDELMKDK